MKMPMRKAQKIRISGLVGLGNFLEILCRFRKLKKTSFFYNVVNMQNKNDNKGEYHGEYLRKSKEKEGKN